MSAHINALRILEELYLRRSLLHNVRFRVESFTERDADLCMYRLFPGIRFRDDEGR